MASLPSNLNFEDNKQSNPIDRQDIFLLLEAYKNQVSLTTTLLEQQKYLGEKELEIAKKQDEIVFILKEIIKRFDNCSVNSMNIKSDMTEIRSCIENKTAEGKNAIELKHNDLKAEVSQIRNMIYIVYVGFAGIILSLITMVTDMWDKFSLLKEVSSKLAEIATKLGVHP